MRLGLRHQYALTIAISAVAVASLVQLFSYWESIRLANEFRRSSAETMSIALRRVAETDARHLAVVLSDSLVDPLVHEDFEEIYNILHAASSLPQMIEIFVYDAEAKVVHDATKEIDTYGTAAPEAIRDLILAGGQGGTKAIFHESKLEICAPIMIGDRMIGALQFATSLDDIRNNTAKLDGELASINQESANKHLRNFVGLTFCLVLLGILAGFFFAGQLIRPIQDLIKITRQLGRRNFNVDLPWRRSDELGELAGALCSMADEIQESMISRSELEKTVHERTSELQKANNKLQVHDQHCRRFLAEVSHELRTPLTVVHGEAQVTLRSTDADVSSYQDCLDRIIRQTKSMGVLVDDLLNLARADDHLAVYQFEEVPLADILRLTSENARILATDKRIVIRSDDYSDNLIILADRQKLVQLLMKLVDNAISYSPHGSIIGITGHSKEGAVEIVIDDQGIGLDAANQDRVFDPFFRGAEARQLRPGGSGLGLPIAKAIADAHNGMLTIIGVPGRGTTVRLRLPLSLDLAA
ncbi:MAG: ATP-binding protein [Geminicoccaceae bacterium]